MSISTSDVIVDATVGLTDTELRASPINVNATFSPSGTQDVNVVSTIPIPVTDNAGSLTVDGTVGISGSVAVTGPLTDTQLRATAVPVSGAFFPATQPVSGTVTTITGNSSTSVITQVVLTNNTNGTLLAANANRRKAIIFAPSSTLQIKLGVTASLTSFTYKVVTNSTTIEVVGWSGQIDAFGTGQTVTITELT